MPGPFPFIALPLASIDDTAKCIGGWIGIFFFPALLAWIVRKSPGCVTAILVVTALGLLWGVASGALTLP
jgi:hypothetical protein